MDDLQVTEQRIVRELQRRAGPPEPVDATAILDAVATRSPKWRFPNMFSAAKFVVAGALVALVGGFLLSGPLTEPDRQTPAAEASEVAVEVSGTIGDPFAPDEPTDVYEGDGLTAGSYVLDGLTTDFDDDRLDGTLTGRADMAFYEPEIAVIGGPITITNEGGTWSGDIQGAGVIADDWVLLITLDGTGAYAGLSATLFPNADGSDPTAATGVIYTAGDLDPSLRPKATEATD